MRPRAAPRALLACALLAACGVETPAPHALRALEPPDGTLSTATLDRAEIGAETRPVLAASRRAVLRWEEDVQLDGDLDVAVELPSDLASSGSVRIDAWLSVPEAKDRVKDMWERRTQEFGGRERLPAEPLIMQNRTKAHVRIPVGEEWKGVQGLLTVVARPLGASCAERQETPRFRIPPGARLAFGFAVEPPGWDEGWPPVHFRVKALSDIGAEPEGGVLLFERRIDPAADPRDRRWFDASVDLAALAGRSVRFVFEAEALGHASGATIDRSFPLISNPEVIVGGRGTPPTARNLILVSLDTLRARSVHSYGNVRETTPVMDRRLGGEGARVRFVVVPIPFTPPAHMTMLTGLEPCVHGVRDRQDVLSAERITLAEMLRAAGYKTAAFTEDAYLMAAAGFARGFDRYAEQRSEESAAPGFAAETFAAAEQWLDSVDGQPFFLFVHTYQVHDPYRPPRGYSTFFRDDGVADALPEAHRDSMTDYEREIRYTDDLLGGFLDALDAHGLARSTVVVVTSDHGEGFGEHFWGGHGFDLHDEALLVPLFVRAPGLVPAGQVVEPQVGLVDLVPTLLDLLAIPLPTPVQGRSFASLLRDRDDGFEERPIVSSALGDALDSVRTRTYKYMQKVDPKPFRAYYDLEHDPDERRNLLRPQGGADPAAAQELLQRHREACEAFVAAHPASSAEAVRPENRPGWLINRDEIDRKLKSLGYVE